MSVGKSNITRYMSYISGATLVLILVWFDWFRWGCKWWWKHHVAPEVDVRSSKLIKPLNGGKHLAESIVTTRLSPRLLDCGNMAGFCDRGAEAIRGTKLHDVVKIMNEGVLAWKGESSRMNTKCLEHFMVLMEAFERSLKLSQSGLCDFPTTYDIADVDECRDAFEYLRWDISTNSV